MQTFEKGGANLRNLHSDFAAKIRGVNCFW